MEIFKLFFFFLPSIFYFPNARKVKKKRSKAVFCTRSEGESSEKGKNVNGATVNQRSFDQPHNQVIR